jgi:hypothetical protein
MDYASSIASAFPCGARCNASSSAILRPSLSLVTETAQSHLETLFTQLQANAKSAARINIDSSGGQKQESQRHKEGWKLERKPRASVLKPIA